MTVPDEVVPDRAPVDPEQVLLPGRSDATRLTWLWLVRRACTGLPEVVIEALATADDD